ncbi:MAG: DUF1501 domain-containing protein [Pirellulaceae bacterium]|nr:DUF1501 domain-containing protein [Planctomycetales bacterium]
MNGNATRHAPLLRRDFLRIGYLASLGIGWREYFGPRRWVLGGEVASAFERRADACILVWLDGGPSHVDSWDPKPRAPLEVRGPFAAISTSVPGVGVSELLPQFAKQMKRWSILRSVASPLGEHNLGTHYMLSGFKPTPALDYPSFSAVVDQHRRHEGELPSHIAVPHHRVGGGRFAARGFLPARFSPFEVDNGNARRDSLNAETPESGDGAMTLYPGLTSARLEQRRRYLHQLEVMSESAQRHTPEEIHPGFEQAFRLMTSATARAAFDLESESAETLGRYGSREIGRNLLLARRLVERGVPLVTVNNVGWDTHNNMVTRLKEGYTGAKVPVGLFPSLDQGLSALVTDLIERDLFDRTLVVVMGEFGRTPKINTLGGRDHWPRVFSVAMAGGGTLGGQVIGASDAMGESPLERPISPPDITATIYALMGIDPATVLHSPDGRPIKIGGAGQVIRELYG